MILIEFTRQPDPAIPVIYYRPQVIMPDSEIVGYLHIKLVDFCGLISKSYQFTIFAPMIEALMSRRSANSDDT